LICDLRLAICDWGNKSARISFDNPQLARLKELELLQGMLAGAKTTFVFGQGDIAEQVRTLVGQENSKAT
jgi:hypothetical protein